MLHRRRWREESGGKHCYWIGHTLGDAPSTCALRAGPNRQLTDAVYSGNQQVGWRWADAHSVYSQWHPVLPPNSPTCGNAPEDWALVTAGSFHPGGVNVVFCDGSVHFITNSVNAGDPTLSVKDVATNPDRPQDYSGPSLRGVWGVLAPHAEVSP